MRRPPLTRPAALILVLVLALAATTAVSPPSAAREAGVGWSLGPRLSEAVANVLAMAVSPPGPYRQNLFERGDFVHQQTAWWCVAASVQMMMNMMAPGPPDRSRALQRRLHFQARALDREGDAYWRRLAGEERWRKGLHGLGLDDWSGLLDARGFGPYRLARAGSRAAAIRKAARAIRLTGRPVGLVVWRGAHAWVMSGFKADRDPAFSADFRVRKVFVSDPWYPTVSSIWGRSPRPNTAMTVKALANDFLPYDRPGRRHPWRDGRFLLILPELPAPTADG